MAYRTLLLNLVHSKYYGFRHQDVQYAWVLHVSRLRPLFFNVYLRQFLRLNMEWAYSRGGPIVEYISKLEPIFIFIV